jgi:signal transduction histidine kinase
VSEPVASALPAHPALRDCIENRDESVVAVGTDGGRRYCEVSISPVQESADQDLDLVVLHDVTAQREQQRALERENEQLDQFASFMSHDLRNPLDVAMGRTTVIAELVEDPQIREHIDEIDRAHSRMLRIIEDVLTLAREGQSINEKTEVEVGAVAADAWSHVETDDATLVVEDNQFLRADPERLGQVFENLFRNSVEHGSTGNRTESDDSVEDGSGAETVTVTVGCLTEMDGFYVADDGPGIDPDLRDRVLEAGFTGDEDGTGLGLGIVSNIAGAHEWDVDVTESKSGGARFEFVGVDIVTEVDQ